MVAVDVRPAHPDDAALLALVHVRAWQAAYRGIMPQEYLDGLDAAARERGWHRHLTGPHVGSQVLVATVAQTLVGFVGLGPARDPDPHADGELHALNVHPDHWGHGAGSALITAAGAGLAGLGHHQAVLWVAVGNARARSFYERHGWAAEPVTKTEPIGGADVAEIRYARAVP